MCASIRSVPRPEQSDQQKQIKTYPYYRFRHQRIISPRPTGDGLNWTKQKKRNQIRLNRVNQRRSAPGLREGASRTEWTKGISSHTSQFQFSTSSIHSVATAHSRILIILRFYYPTVGLSRLNLINGKTHFFLVYLLPFTSCGRRHTYRKNTNDFMAHAAWFDVDLVPSHAASTD